MKFFNPRALLTKERGFCIIKPRQKTGILFFLDTDNQKGAKKDGK